MLQKLTIQNFAIIEALDIHFSDHLNVITGETGAGKSILIGALSMLMGSRADSKLVFKDKSKCVIEGTFLIGGYQMDGFFIDHNLDYASETVLRREIGSDGKSRAFINDTPVTLPVIRDLGLQLVDIHSQHETLDMNTPAFQMRLLDLFAEQVPLIDHFKSELSHFNEIKKKIDSLETTKAVGISEREYLQFQLDEIEAARIQGPDEQAHLERELEELAHAEEIKKELSATRFLLDDAEQSALVAIKDSIRQLQSIVAYFPSIQSSIDRLQSVYIETKDVADEIDAYEEKITVNDARMALIQERLNVLFKLEQKHRVNGLPALIELRENLSTKLHHLFADDESLTILQSEAEKLQATLHAMASELSAKRKSVIPDIESNIESLLRDTGIGHPIFKIVLSPTDAFTTFGKDKVSFSFSANKGFKPLELSQVASGGELSRLMLALKTLTSRFTSIPTVIFDEIDTGVSGEIALKVGKSMETLSEEVQVIAITHLPQIASRGQAHYYVFKETKGEATLTNIRKLNAEERVMEIAKMLSGNQPGEYAIKNAKELLETPS